MNRTTTNYPPLSKDYVESYRSPVEVSEDRNSVRDVEEPRHAGIVTECSNEKATYSPSRSSKASRVVALGLSSTRPKTPFLIPMYPRRSVLIQCSSL
ncbi:hypothetical protein TNCV_2564901 [Trichonephila clavipes]|nr:hypothetical protein TNCV_2564901 [Trichonephila clavipes]